MSKKHLDEFFQEKFKGFEETPDDKVWVAIASSLDRKKKKRILPLWWQLAGVAAVLVFGLLLLNPFDTGNSPNVNSVTDTEQKQSDDTLLKETIRAKDAVSSAPKDVNPAEIDTNTNSQPEGFIVETDKSRSTPATNGGIRNATKNEATNISNQAKVAGTEPGNKINKSENLFSGQAITHRNRQESQFSASGNKTTGEPKEKEQVAEPSMDNPMVKPNAETIAFNEEKENIQSTVSEGKKSLYDEIQDQEEEENAASKTSGNKWSAGPSIAPVYFDALGTGSPVSPMFSANTKSGNVNMSYGLSVAYEISPRLSVRSGVHKVDYGYDTNDVYFTSSISALSQNRISNINYAQTAENLVVSSSNAALNLDSKSFDISARTANRSGVMAQQLGYLEVPVELSYALVNTKFGVHVIGGVSSLFLVENQVDLTSGSLTTQIGEANNVNDLNFSANFGIGLGYQFSQRLKLNVEPVFKYQLNTFSNVDGTFNPYTLGVYSGISFKF
ncbi:outer membrane beta-barrel protein [Maribacter sp. 4G9]|uniref:outer membrane beta-barrel protein n=1 Tax=Maribacter sp. 4G9 TaxID=1889777 RepID=UPI000C144D57|nr:outer membrane beta-barrel protein [Maribacter sp. 4G9]PIB37997.1 hypothetical protein BFP75_18540 [Maribacter sp. 4G9]